MIADPASNRWNYDIQSCKAHHAQCQGMLASNHMAYPFAKQVEHVVQGCVLTSPVEDPVSEQLEMIQQRVIANLIVLQNNGRWSASGCKI